MNEPLPSDQSDVPRRRAWLLAVLVVALLWAAIGPTLRWVQFSNGIENILVQTALEMRHGGDVLLPDLLGEPRVKKPPLATWITAAAMRPQTVQQLSDPAVRDRAYVDLALEARAPALLAAGLLVLATFSFARTWGGNAVGLCAAMAAATNYLSFKYLRLATTDAHLAAWVAIANACFVRGLLRGGRWTAALGGGFATGMAFMCKGPVALAETIAPALVVFVVLRIGRERPTKFLKDDGDSQTLAAWIAGVALFTLVGLPWFIYVLTNVPDVTKVWATEVTREGSTNLDQSSPFGYLLLGPMMGPWVIFGVVGLLSLWRLRRVRSAWAPMIFAAVPLLVMVWFRDRKERYMLPMIMPAATICGYGVAAWMRSWMRHRTKGDVIVICIHTITLLAAGIALALLGGTKLKRLDGAAWYPRAMMFWMIGAMVLLAGLAVVLVRRRAWVAPAATFVGVLGAIVLFYFGLSQTEEARSPLKPLADAILAKAPGAIVYDWLPRGRADEQIALYLNNTILRADPATLRPLDRPIVLITRQAPLKQSREGDLEPLPPLSNNWQPLASQMEGKVMWSAFVWR